MRSSASQDVFHRNHRRTAVFGFSIRLFPPTKLEGNSYMLNRLRHPSWGLAKLVITFVIPLALSATLTAAEHTKDSLETVKSRVASGKAVLLDVRELSEWKEGHVKGAKLSPLSKLRKAGGVENAKKSLPKDKIIYCHCRSGGRCLIATDLLKKEGLDVRALRPGYEALIEAGFEKAE